MPTHRHAGDTGLEADVRALLAENLVLAPRYATTPYWSRLAADANRLFQQFLADSRAVDPAELSAMYYQTEAGRRWRIRRYGRDVVAEPRARRLDVLARMGRVLGVDVTGEANVSGVERLNTVGEAAQLLRKSPNTLRRLLHDGQLAGGKVGGTWRISASELERLMHDGLPNAAGQPFLAGVQAAAFTMNRDLVITGWSPGAKDLFGYSRPDAIGRSVDLIRTLRPENRAAAIRRAEREGAWEGDGDLLAKDDKVVHVNCRTIRIDPDHWLWVADFPHYRLRGTIRYPGYAL